MLVLLLLYVGSGCLLAALSLPLIWRKIGPNPWYGFRVRRTMTDPAVWFAVNEYAGKRLLAVGILTVISSLAFFFMPDIDLDTYALACAGIALTGLFVTVVQSFRFLGSLTRRG